MKLTKVDYGTIRKGYKPTNLVSVIDEFIAMNTEAVEITGYDHKTPYSCTNALNTCAKHNKHHHIKARVIDGKPYLLNTNLIKEKEV